MLNDIKKIIFKDKILRNILLAGILLQLGFAIFTRGFYHADQHYQVIEFSSYQLGEPNATYDIWEFKQGIRPTLQVYLFSAYRSTVEFLGIKNPFSQLTVLRVLTALFLFVVFNIFSIYFTNAENKKTLYIVLVILNFSWCLPYIRTLFSSEMFSSAFFFGTILLYERKKNKDPHFIFLSLIGFMLCLAFYFRFQTAFFIIGFLTWLIFIEKRWKHLLPVSAGFIAGILINTWLDYEFYNHLLFTPYKYFYANILERKAASFGTASPLVYLRFLLVAATAFPISIFLFYYLIKASKEKFRHLLFITILFYFLFHCLVGHKEERFMFPILAVFPVIMGWGIPLFSQYYKTCKNGIRIFFKSVIAFSIVFNTLLLYVLMFHNPASQLIGFTSYLDNFLRNSSAPSNIYCAVRNPLFTSFGGPLTYYSTAFQKNALTVINDIDSIRHLPEKNTYLATTFDVFKKNQLLIESLRFKPVYYSSGLWWKFNELYSRKKGKGLFETWVLYKRE